jgi:DnaK suppressor protein
MARKDALLKIQKALIGRRAELRKRLGSQLADLGVGKSSSPSGDVADAAFGHTGEELASQLAELESRELAQIEHALVRIKQGKYGACAGCAAKIPVARLNILPYSTLCIKCAQEAENDSEWLEDRIHGDWSSVRDASEDRDVNLSELEIDLSK